MKAFITLLSSADYYDGVIVLKRSLQAVRSRYPFYCVLAANIDELIEGRLIKDGIQFVRLTQHVDTHSRISGGSSFERWNNTFDKLQIWGLTQFEKIVFLDSDVLVMNNIDHLFDCEPFSGVCAGKSYPGHDNWTGINSGVMVIEPDIHVKRKLIELIPIVSHAYEQKNRLMGDQDVLQWFLKDRWDDNSSLQLDEGYNVFADFLKYYIRSLGYSWEDEAYKKIYVVHFIGKAKPWMKLSLRERYWLLKKWILNPYYIEVRRKYRYYLSYQ